MKSTIIYYTANRELAAFEQKVIDGINKVKGDVPVVSVSQKPLAFGKNICVGDVGHTYLNAFRQLLIGCQEATSEYVIMAESDCFYPPTGYFDFVPSDLNVIYSYDDVWILWQNGKDAYFRKEQTHASLIYGREFLIKLLTDSLKGLPEWSREKIRFPFYTQEHKFIYWRGAYPIVNVKTGRGVQKGTRLMDTPPKTELPYFGTAKDFKCTLQ